MTSAILESLTTFGELLRHLRRRARLTQRELGLAVGYSEAHIGRLESNERRPEIATVSMRFVEALDLEHEPQLAARLIALASAAHGQPIAQPEDAIGFVGLKRNNLPALLSSFIGREREIDKVGELLGAHRLVTLTGPGGVGKTRLAIQTASAALGNYADGVCWVELAALADPALVPHSVVTALGMSEGTGRPILDVLTGYLRERRLLLALDNCEHLIEACARLVDSLLRACPSLKILATSRERLSIDGEVVYRVPSLSFPEPQNGVAVEVDHLMGFEAVRLFVERAGAATSDFRVTAQNTKALAQICQRLDGIPLAIELAAARTSAMTVEQIAARLDDRFQLLTGGSRTALPRHQTLRALIDWSYALLSEAEQVVLRRLSVFAGGWTLEAAEAVVSSDAGDVLDGLTHLVNKSLIIVERIEHKVVTGVRYRLPETIRQYARDRLTECFEDEAIRDRHLSCFLKLAERAAPELRATDQVIWLDRLEAELDNIRAALAWALEGEDEGHVEAGLRLATALIWLWHIRDYKREGAEWLERLLAAEAHMAGTQPRTHKRILIRARALNAAAWHWRMLWDYAKKKALARESLALLHTLDDPDKSTLAFAKSMYYLFEDVAMNDTHRVRLRAEECVALYREAGDRFGMAECLGVLGWIALRAGNFEQAKLIHEQELALRAEFGDKDGIANVYRNYGNFVFRQGDFIQAAALFEKSLALFSEVRNKWGVGVALFELGRMALVRGDYGQAHRQANQSLVLGQDLGDRENIASSHFWLGAIAQSQGDYAQATLHLEEQLALFRELHHPGSSVIALCNLGRVALAQGDHEQAALRFEEALATSLESGDNFAIAAARFGQGCMAQAKGDFAAAQTSHKAALALRSGEHDMVCIAESFDALAVVAVAHGQAQQAAQLFGASETLYALIRFMQPLFERDMHAHALAEARAQLGEEAFAAAWAEGKAMTPEGAIAYALH